MIALILLKRILVSILLAWIGIWVLRNTAKLLSWVGDSELFENFLGNGGTITMWKLIGIGLVVLAILVFGGTFSFAGL